MCTHVPCPRTRSTATIHIEMRDERGMTFVDDFALSFHMHFHRLLKWLLAAPFLACAAAILSVKFDDFPGRPAILSQRRQQGSCMNAS